MCILGRPQWPMLSELTQMSEQCVTVQSCVQKFLLSTIVIVSVLKPVKGLGSVWLFFSAKQLLSLSQPRPDEDHKGGVPISPGKFQYHKCTQHYLGHAICFNLLCSVYKQTGREGRSLGKGDKKQALMAVVPERNRGQVSYGTTNARSGIHLVMQRQSDPQNARRKNAYGQGPHGYGNGNGLRGPCEE